MIGHTFGFTSGFGLDWRNYHLEGNTHLLDNNGETTVFDAPDDINYTYSRLRTLHLTVPVLLEWQPTFGKNRNFFMTAGVVGGWNVMASYRVKYKNANGDKISIKGRRSRWRGATPLSTKVGQLERASVGWAMPFSRFASR